MCRDFFMSGKIGELLLLVVLIIINGLFSMTETAVVSLRKARLQKYIDEGNKKASIALDLSENPSDFFSTIQIVISLVGVVTGALGASAFSGGLAQYLKKIDLLKPVADTLALLLVSIGITYFSLVIGELIPKRLAISNPEKISMRMGGLMRSLSKVSKPLVAFLSWSTELGIKLIGVTESGALPVSEDEVKVMIEQGKQVGVFEETEQDIVESVFRMSDRTVDAMMTPRTELTWIDLDEPLEDSLSEILHSDDVFFPTVRGNADNVVGVISSKKLLDCYIRGDQIDLDTISETPLFIPESKPALSVLDDLRDSGKQVAIVMDEYGGFSGMITLIDILSELVGEVPGLNEGFDPQIVERADGSWLLDGQLDVDELKDTLDIKELPDEDRIGYQTLGGFILSQIGFIPSVGDSFVWEDYRFEIVDMDNRRIDKVLVDRNKKDQPEDHNPQSPSDDHLLNSDQ
ncbi:hemolysin [Flexilinea flocculi]|jgi:putative hemolysin|uniref:Hemolysin n=2 Tax=Flexilinea flocculi TaxID=1678840 RepID=A0A0K8P9X9_9CHLR|nr:hemolysin [Flexilinea flocculi]